MASSSGKTSSGIDQNLAGLLCYILGWLTGIIFLILENKNKFVRFHALQSILFFGAVTVVAVILGVIPIVGWIINIFVYIFAFIMWVVLMYNAYQGKKFKLPIAGDMAEKQTK